MARTVRRKGYVPSHVTNTWEYVQDPVTGESFYRNIRLEGAERQAKLRWWHEDKSCWWGARPPKPFRQEVERAHRMTSKAELQKWWRNENYEPLCRRKALLPYWD